jgi:TPP-dependent pyruvate/acetoin dehydrogenase alpha subunit
VRQHVAIDNFAERAAAYGIPGLTIDGNDVIAVYGATSDSVERARRGGGPTLIEVKTFRRRGHAEHDDAFYVPKELAERWEKRDPIARLSAYLHERGLWTDEEKNQIDIKVQAEVDAGLEWAEQSPLPDPATQPENVYR